MISITICAKYSKFFLFSATTGKKVGGNDAKFFTTNRKGENHELREELRSQQRDRKRDAVKKVFFFSFPTSSLKFP